MGKLSASIDKKKMKDRPELIALVKDVQTKEAAFEAIKSKKEKAKDELKHAKKALRKAMKKKPAKPAKDEVAIKALKNTTVKKPATQNAPKSAAAPKAASTKNGKAVVKKTVRKTVAA